MTDFWLAGGLMLANQKPCLKIILNWYGFYLVIKRFTDYDQHGQFLTVNGRQSQFHSETLIVTRPHFYQTRSAWSVDQGSNKNHSPAYNFAPTVTKFCVMWEGLSLPHDTKFVNCRCKIVDSRSFPSWSLIHGLRWSGLIKVGPGETFQSTRDSRILKGKYSSMETATQTYIMVNKSLLPPYSMIKFLHV